LGPNLQTWAFCFIEKDNFYALVLKILVMIVIFDSEAFFFFIK